MLIYILWGVTLIFSILATHFYDVKKEQKVWDYLEEVIESARNGTLEIRVIDETNLSSIKNTLRRLVEDSCLAKENMVSQKEKIQTLISDISHQTITPISNILLYSQLLEEQIEGTDTKNSIKAIQEQAEKLNFLIDSLVKASRMENGIIKTVPKINNVLEMLQGVLEQAEKKAVKKNINIILEYSEEIEAYFDFKWTQEAIYNIVDNAIKYTPENGKIHMNVLLYPMFCRIDIADNGVGMEEEEMPKIFGRFYRCGRTSSEKGVGLGLFLTRNIIDNENGYIKVSSELGVGTTFSVFLPNAGMETVKVSKV